MIYALNEKMKRIEPKTKIREHGQTVAEYATVLALFLLTSLMLLVLLSSFNEYGKRILSLVGLDYP